MLVRAVRMGYHNGGRVRPGQVFEYDGDKLPQWVEPADAPESHKVEPSLDNNAAAAIAAAGPKRKGTKAAVYVDGSEQGTPVDETDLV